MSVLVLALGLSAIGNGMLFAFGDGRGLIALLFAALLAGRLLRPTTEAERFGANKGVESREFGPLS